MQSYRFSVVIAALIGLVQFGPTASAQTSSPSVRDSFQERLAPVLANTFPMRSVAECDKQGSIYHSGDVDITTKGATVVIGGSDTSKHKWQVQAPITGLGCTIFQADLDGNGMTDLIIHSLGITSNDSYDTLLTVLLFDQQGRPVPWTTTGRYDLTSNGIRQITRGANDQALILHSYTVGLPMWGVSYVANLYSASGATIKLLNGPTSGITFPLVTGSQTVRQSVLQAVTTMNLSTSVADQLSAPGTHPLFVRYGAAATLQSAKSNVPLTADQAASLQIDTAAVEAAKKHIMLSNNTTLEIPSILIVDSANGDRNIVVHPDDRDFARLQPKPYELIASGTDCDDSDDCRPFTIRAVEQKN